MPEVEATPRWLFLVHQLPSRSANVRVHIWRRLQQVGAIALRKSIYVLPHSPEAREDFEWIRREIVDRHGQASVLAASAVDGYTDDELKRSFRKARSAEYETFIQHTDALATRIGRARPSRATVRRHLARASAQLLQLKARDYFNSPGARDAQAALERLHALGADQDPQPAKTARLHSRTFRRRTWLTRPHPGIDRMASAWLIRRFIAPDARFVFASRPARRDEVPFDMPDVEFGHHGTDCTFETIVRKFGITDAAAVRVGHVVHDLDLKESRYSLPETATIGRLVEGFRAAGPTDDTILERGAAMIDALYQSFVNDTTPARQRRAARHRARR